MKKLYKIAMGLVVIFLLTASAYIATPYVINSYQTRDWETFTNKDFGFTFKYPKDMQASGGLSPTTKGDVTIYRLGGISFIEDSYNSRGSIAISIVEGKENLDEQYSDREKVRIRGKNWRYYTSGELTNTRRRDSATGELSSEGDLDEEYIYFWKEYITRFSPELRFEVYATYENPEYSRIMDTMVRSITFLNTNKQSIKTSEDLQLPATVFDATATAPGTRLAFSYPSNGFYGLGAEISTGSGYEGETERFIDIDPNSIYAAEKGSQLVNLRITAYNLPDEKASLEDFIHATFPSEFVEGYVKKSGEYREINGIRFLLVALVDKDPISRFAWTLVDNKVVEINLIYGLDDSPESQAALLNNDQLFLQILETIRLQ